MVTLTRNCLDPLLYGARELSDQSDNGVAHQMKGNDMSDKTTLERCVPYFKRTGWFGRLDYDKNTGIWYIKVAGNIRWFLTDDEATSLIKEELWRRICRHSSYVKRRHEEGCKYFLETDVTSDVDPDELALLLQAAEEIET